MKINRMDWQKIQYRKKEFSLKTQLVVLGVLWGIIFYGIIK